MIDIIVMSRPLPQSRPRFGKDGVVYSDATPELTKYKSKIVAKCIGKTLPDGPLCIVSIFGMPIKDKKKHFKLSTSRPDIDNLIKPCLDAMQKSKLSKSAPMPLADDGRISVSIGFKIHVPEDKGFVRLIVSPVEDIAQAIDKLSEYISHDGVIGSMARLGESK